MSRLDEIRARLAGTWTGDPFTMPSSQEDIRTCLAIIDAQEKALKAADLLQDVDGLGSVQQRRYDAARAKAKEAAK